MSKNALYEKYDALLQPNALYPSVRRGGKFCVNCHVKYMVMPNATAQLSASKIQNTRAHGCQRGGMVATDSRGATTVD